jgi:DNA-directed RNA polymerase subunit RPC12/RpoP
MQYKCPHCESLFEKRRANGKNYIRCPECHRAFFVIGRKVNPEPKQNQRPLQTRLDKVVENGC